MGLILRCAAMRIPASAGGGREGEFKRPDFYPESVNGCGCIDRIDRDGVVIDNRSMGFPATATF